MKKAGIYLRVSTQEQAQEGYSIQAQKERLINYCKAKDWNIADIYIDAGYSGSNVDRPGIQKLISDIKKLDIVLVYKLDRLSRSQKDTLYLIEDIFLKNNVDFVSMNESFDTSTPFGRAMIGILSVFAQLERETIKERSLMGRIERAKEGYFHGGGFIPTGYDYVDGKLVINEYEAMQVREVFRMYIEGCGTDRIGKIMTEKGFRHKNGHWGYASIVNNVLANQLYIGKVTFQGETFDGLHEPIISEETFNKAQAMRTERTRKTHFQTNSLLAGFIYCANCNAKYFVRQVTKKHKYYGCYSRSKNHPHMVKDQNCKNKYWPINELNSRIEKEILNLAVNSSQMILESDKELEQDNSSTIKNQIKELDKQIGRLMDLYQIGNLPAEEISKRIEDLYNSKSH